MPARRRLVLVLVLAFVAFLIAGETHGRQLRQEREAHGFLHMDPVKGWPPAMHEIWQLDRARLGAGTAAAAVLGVVAAVATGAGLGTAAMALLLWAPTMGFLIAAAFSLLRLHGHDAAAAAATLPGTAFFVALTLLCLLGSVMIERGRRAAAAE